MTNTFTPNTLAWFEVATDDPDTATSFYADLFGWTFSPFGDPETTGIDYRVAALAGSGAAFGGGGAAGEARRKGLQQGARAPARAAVRLPPRSRRQLVRCLHAARLRLWA